MGLQRERKQDLKTKGQKEGGKVRGSMRISDREEARGF